LHAAKAKSAVERQLIRAELTREASLRRPQDESAIDRRERQEAARVDRVNMRKERAFFQGSTSIISYAEMNPLEAAHVMERLANRVVENGERLLIQNRDGRTKTLSRETALHLKHVMRQEAGADDNSINDYESSDVEFTGTVKNGEYSISRAPSHTGGAFTRNQGAFWPFLHNFKDEPYVEEVLAELGCFSEIRPENYKNNCLYNAFKAQGVAEEVLEAMTHMVKRRKVSRMNIRSLAEDFDLRVTIRTDGDRNNVHYGAPDGHPVDLALLHDHYFVYKTKTNITSFALKNYKVVKQQKTRDGKWWERKNISKNDASKGLNTLNLMKTLIEEGFMRRIDISDHEILQTQFHDEVSREFKTLEYPSKHARLHHPQRNPGRGRFGHEVSVAGGDEHIGIVEQVNKERLKHIIDNHEQFDLGSAYVNGEHMDKKGQLTLLRGYYKSLDDNGCVAVTYKAKMYDGARIGRRYGHLKLQLQNMSRRIRHTIAEESLLDLDMSNCHPRLIQWWCKQRNISSEGLGFYIDNRNRCLCELSDVAKGETRDDAKRTMLAILNGRDQSEKQLKERPRWFRQYYDNVREIHQAVKKERPDLWDIAVELKREKDGYNVEGTCVNILMSIMEDNALMALKDVCDKLGIKLASLQFDGLMLYRSSLLRAGTPVEELCRQMEAALEDAMPGCQIPIEEKQMTEGYNLTAFSPNKVPTEPQEDACCDEEGVLLAGDKNTQKQIAIAAGKVSPATLVRLKEKIKTVGYGRKEQLKLLIKHEEPEAHVFYDFETTTEGERHEAYMVCYMEEGDDEVQTKTGPNCAMQFLNDLVMRYGVVDKSMTDKGFDPPVVKILAHNHTYDLSFILPHVSRINTVERGMDIVCGSCLYRLGGKVVKLLFKDTYKMISMPLSAFGASFHLSQQKEVMPYELYTQDFIQSGALATKSQIKRCAESQSILENLSKWDCGVGVKFDMIKYSAEYCRMDVMVLRNGWRVFRTALLNENGIDPNCYHTMASLSDEYFNQMGCFAGVYEIAATPQAFIANACVGGRVCTANNVKIESKGDADFDGNSLYPSAMARLPGYLCGKPKVWNSNIDLDNVDGYFLEIKISNVEKNWAIPIARLKDSEGGNRWTNELEGETIVVDRFALEDLLLHCKIEYEINKGYYYDNGRNTRVNQTIQKMYDNRRRYKKEGNPMQLVLKLMMNAAYGKTGLKAVDTDVAYIGANEKPNYIHNHFNRIREYVEMPNGETRFECYKEISTHFNRQHIACEILSMSKKIMNEVVCTAEEIGASVNYTDTDSMHLPAHKIPELASAFQAKYGRELIGNKLGQFHSDFEFDASYHVGSNGKLQKVGKSVKVVGDVIALESIFLGKKSYIDKLQDEDGNEAYHIRLKGIPTKCILAKADAEYGGNPLALYKDLHRGRGIEFDLNMCFKYNKNHTVKTTSMKRRVQF
jgi:hypothetical protein